MLLVAAAPLMAGALVAMVPCANALVPSEAAKAKAKIEVRKRCMLEKCLQSSE